MHWIRPQVIPWAVGCAWHTGHKPVDRCIRAARSISMCARRSRSYLAPATVFFFATLHPAVPNNAIALICRSAKHLASPLPRFAPLCLCTSLCCAAMLLLCCDSPVAGLPWLHQDGPYIAIAVLSLHLHCCSYQNLALAAIRFALPCLCFAKHNSATAGPCSTMPLLRIAVFCLALPLP